MTASPRTATRPAAPAGEDLAARLRLAVVRLNRRLRGQDDGGLTLSQLAALATVARHGSLTVGELSVAERVKPPTTTRIVASLEELGLVTRTVDPADRRVARLAPTAAGRRYLERSRSRKDAYLASRLAALDPADRAALAEAVAVLERLVEEPA